MRLNGIIDMKRMQTQLKHLTLKSPLMTASGTSGHSGEEISNLEIDRKILGSLGAFVTKGITVEPRDGNRTFRIVETRIGLLNAIGLQNKGVKFFIEKELPGLLNFGLPIIVNIAGNTIKEFEKIASYLSDNDLCEIITGIEINVSCPNIKKGGVAFGTDPRLVEKIVSSVKKRIPSRMLLTTKLTPNVTDITLPARAAIEGGTDALSMINTLRGMAINVETGEPLLDNKTGGLSGPAIKPVGVYMVYECFEKINECNRREIPIIGIGGIATWRDALEYIMAGATAVAIGTAWFVNQKIFIDIYRELHTYLEKKDRKIMELVGKAHETI
jgi:dihydroorotate dehydrogenase (NAD+) catalytic subunit